MKDDYFMSIALQLARRGLGNVAPNPAVGCIIVNEGTIIGRGWTQPGGRPHAEIVALEQAKHLAKGSIVYVTLEPCCHYGQTDPCALALIKAGIKKIVIAIKDPDKRVNGKGIEMLKQAGIEVKLDVMSSKAKEINLGFFYSKNLYRPLITAKIATSLDGKIAIKNGSSKWITNSQTRYWVHKLRAEYDAIMIGSNTLVTDDPLLTCRLPGLEMYSPIRVIIDRKYKLSDKSNIAITAHSIPTWVIVNSRPRNPIPHIEYITISNINFLHNLCSELSKRGITRLLIEGGSHLITEFIKQDLLDNLIWCRANKILGNDSIPAISTLNLLTLEQNYLLCKKKVIHFNEDIVEFWSFNKN